MSSTRDRGSAGHCFRPRALSNGSRSRSHQRRPPAHRVLPEAPVLPVPRSDQRDAGVVAAGSRRQHHGNRTFGALAAQAGQQSLDHAAVDRAQDGVLRRRVPERTAVRHYRSGRHPDPRRGPRIRGRSGCRRWRAWPLEGSAVRRPVPCGRPGSARILRPHARPCARRLLARAGRGPPQQQDEQVIPTGEQIEGGIVADHGEALRRSPGAVARRTFHGDVDVPAGGQTFQMVASHIGVERETGGHLQRRLLRGWPGRRGRSPAESDRRRRT